MNNYRLEILSKLKKNNIISYNEILDITNAFQIASGQSYAIEKTKGLLDFLNDGKEILITNAPNDIVLRSKTDLYSLYLSIDKYINIVDDSNFSSYFKHN